MQRDVNEKVGGFAHHFVEILVDSHETSKNIGGIFFTGKNLIIKFWI